MRSPDEVQDLPKKKLEKKQKGGFQEDETNWEQQRDELVQRVDTFVGERYVRGGPPVALGTKACKKAVTGAKEIIENAGWTVKVGWDAEEKERVLTLSSAF